MKALNYKGKHFILADDDVEEDWEGLDLYVDADKVSSKETLLRSHVEACRYYGIPAYIGKNTELKARIETIDQEIDVRDRPNLK